MSRYIAEAGINELRDIQQAVVISADRNGGGDYDACCVYGLEDTLEMALPCYFLDQHRCQSF